MRGRVFVFFDRSPFFVENIVTEDSDLIVSTSLTSRRDDAIASDFVNALCKRAILIAIRLKCLFERRAEKRGSRSPCPDRSAELRLPVFRNYRGRNSLRQWCMVNAGRVETLKHTLDKRTPLMDFCQASTPTPPASHKNVVYSRVIYTFVLMPPSLYDGPVCTTILTTVLKVRQSAPTVRATGSYVSLDVLRLHGRIFLHRPSSLGSVG